MTVTLSTDHKLILYGLVARLNADEHLQFADQAGQRVRWDLECELESKVTARAGSRLGGITRISPAAGT
jgi:hypothetical protein